MSGCSLIGRGDADKDGFSEAAPEEIDRHRQRHTLRSRKLARVLAAIGLTHHGAVIDFARESRRHDDHRKSAVRAQPRRQRRAQIDYAVHVALIFVAFDRYADGFSHHLDVGGLDR